jgi:2-oxo-hept-3-ene-1,7-dioate hydratase
LLTEAQIADAAERLYRAEKDRAQIRALSATLDMDMDDAYAIQRRWVERRLADGEQVIGYKIGLTSRAMQIAMNIDTPDYGVLTDAMRFRPGASIPAGDFLDPRIETEFAFVLRAPLYGTDVSLDEVLEATDYVQPALELISARSQRTDPESGYTRTVLDTIADNAANAGVIPGGERVSPAEVDLRWAGAILSLNGEVEDTGLGAAVLGHPGHGIRWVCRRFAAHGIGLEPGQLVLSGSFTRPVPVVAGDAVVADYGPLGRIEVAFV